MEKILDDIHKEIVDFEGQVAAETLSGNIVKESYTKGVIVGLRIAEAIIREYEG